MDFKQGKMHIKSSENSQLRAFALTLPRGNAQYWRANFYVDFRARANVEKGITAGRPPLIPDNIRNINDQHGNSLACARAGCTFSLGLPLGRSSLINGSSATRS
jgi:hypothetical protein